MTSEGQVFKSVRAAFEREHRINLHKYPVHMDFSDGVLTLEGRDRAYCREEIVPGIGECCR